MSSIAEPTSEITSSALMSQKVRVNPQVAETMQSVEKEKFVAVVNVQLLVSTDKQTVVVVITAHRVHNVQTAQMVVVVTAILVKVIFVVMVLLQ